MRRPQLRRRHGRLRVRRRHRGPRHHPRRRQGHVHARQPADHDLRLAPGPGLRQRLHRRRQALRLLHGLGRRQLLRPGRRGQLPDREQRLLQQRGQLHRRSSSRAAPPCATTPAGRTSAGRAAARSPRSPTARRSSTTSSCRARERTCWQSTNQGVDCTSNAVRLPGRHLPGQVGARALLRRAASSRSTPSTNSEGYNIMWSPSTQDIVQYGRRRTHGTVQEFVSADATAVRIWRARPAAGPAAREPQRQPTGLPAARRARPPRDRAIRLISLPPTSRATRERCRSRRICARHRGTPRRPPGDDHDRRRRADRRAPQAAECRARSSPPRRGVADAAPRRGRASPT